MEALLPLTSQALEGSLQCLADEYAKYELTIYVFFKKIVYGSLGEASLRLWEALESLLGRVEDLSESKSFTRASRAYRLFGKGLHIDDDVSYYESRMKLLGGVGGWSLMPLGLQFSRSIGLI